LPPDITITIVRVAHCRRELKDERSSRLVEFAELAREPRQPSTPPNGGDLIGEMLNLGSGFPGFDREFRGSGE
jgi:hypothetical protein